MSRYKNRRPTKTGSFRKKSKKKSNKRSRRKTLKSIFKSKRKSSKKKSTRKRSITLKRDGMKKGEEEKINIKIKIPDEYIQNINLYYYTPFIKTLSFFRLYHKKIDGFNSINGKSIEIFIKELFTFNRDINNDNLFFQKHTILGFIITSGLYEMFESFASELKKEIDLGLGINCKERDVVEFDKDSKKHLNKLKIIEKTRNFIEQKKVKDNINVNLYEDFKTQRKKKKEQERKEKKMKNEDKEERKEDKQLEDVIEDFIFELSKFIFYFICTVEFNVAKLIMRFYLLSIIKSGILLKYETVLVHNESNKIVNDFIGATTDNFRILKYITLDYKKTDDKLYTFTTCGETTILNLLNYFFKDNISVIQSRENKYSKTLKEFYEKYDKIDKQFESTQKTTIDWLKVVSNFEKKSIYNSNGCINNSLGNIIYVLKLILGTDKSDLISILKEINKDVNVDSLEDKGDSIKILIDNEIIVYFNQGHGDMHKRSDEEKIIIEGENDFLTIYNIFNEMNVYRNPELEMSRIIYNTIEDGCRNYTYLDFLTTIKDFIIRDTYGSSEMGSINIPNSIEHLVNLEKLELSGLSSIGSIEYIGKLKNLKKLNLSNNNIKTLPESIGNLINLTSLDLSTNVNIVIPDMIGNLKNISTLSICNNKLDVFPGFISELTNLENLYLSNNNFNTIPDGIFKLIKIKYLNLNENQLSELPESIRQLENLAYLDISDNQLTTIPESIETLKNLKSLYAYNNIFCKLPESFKKLLVPEQKLFVNKNIERILKEF